MIKDLDPKHTPCENQDCNLVLSLRFRSQPPPETPLLCSSLSALGQLVKEFLLNNSPSDGGPEERHFNFPLVTVCFLFFILFFLLLSTTVAPYTILKPEGAHILTGIPLSIPISSSI